MTPQFWKKSVLMYEPPCYTCRYSQKRGNFRLCRKGKDGYKHIGEEVKCNLYKPIEKEKKNGQ